MKQLRALLPYLRRYRRAIAWGIVLVVISNALAVSGLEFLKYGIDALRGGRIGVIARYAALSALAALLAGAARFGMRQVLNSVSRRVETDLRDDVFAQLLHLDATFHGAHPTGEVMSRATNDLQAVRMVAGPAYMYLVNTIVFTIFAVVRMTWVSPTLTLAALAPMLLLPPVTLGFGRVIHERFERIQAQFGVLSTLAQENFAGVRIVKAYQREADQTARFRTLSEDYMRRNVDLARTSGLFYPLLTLLAGLAMALTLWIGARQIIAGRITVGEYVLFALYLGMMTWPMIALGWVVSLFQRGAASMGRASAVLDAEPRVRTPANAHAPAQVRGEIEFRHVTFTYPGATRPALRDVSFRIPTGSAVAVVGATGAGKSTLVSLLLRLYDPNAGEIRLDGVPLTRWDLAALRGAIAVAPQDAFLFSATIRENLSLGVRDAEQASTDARIRRAARIAHLEEAIERLPAGLETGLGERGINLSGGQKQRTTLARAIARNAPVLVLDDTLSAVDTQTEHRILEALPAALAGRTSIIVSHRVSAVMHADRILVLEDGALVESGTHAELLRRGGIYAALQHRQLLEREIEGAAEDGLAAVETPV